MLESHTKNRIHTRKIRKIIHTKIEKKSVNWNLIKMKKNHWIIHIISFFVLISFEFLHISRWKWRIISISNASKWPLRMDVANVLFIHQHQLYPYPVGVHTIDVVMFAHGRYRSSSAYYTGCVSNDNKILQIKP